MPALHALREDPSQWPMALGFFGIALGIYFAVQLWNRPPSAPVAQLLQPSQATAPSAVTPQQPSTGVTPNSVDLLTAIFGTRRALNDAIMGAIKASRSRAPSRQVLPEDRIALEANLTRLAEVRIRIMQALALLRANTTPEAISSPDRNKLTMLLVVADNADVALIAAGDVIQADPAAAAGHLGACTAAYVHALELLDELSGPGAAA